MIKFDYTKFDDELINMLRSGGKSFAYLLKHSTEDYPSRLKGWHDRAVDRRLQSLRKRGLIRHLDGKWIML